MVDLMEPSTYTQEHKMLANKSGGTYKKPNLFVKENGKYNYVDAYIKDEEEYVRVNDPGISIFSDNKPGLHLNIDDAIKANEDALGPELFTGAWASLPAGWASSVGVLTKSASTLNPSEATTSVVAGRAYRCSFRIVSQITDGSGVSIRIGGASGAIGGFSTGVGVINEVLFPRVSGAIQIVARGATGDWTGTISEISVREIDLSKIVAFEDSAGTVPLLAPLGAGKGCGLLLDRSSGLVRGPELSPSFSSGWGTNDPAWVVSGSTLVATAVPGSKSAFAIGVIPNHIWVRI